MDIKELKQLTAPCGMDCFNCPIFEKNITEEQVSCRGCRNQNGYKNIVKTCKILNCIQNKKIEFCFECDSFPCDAHNPCKDGADVFPHNFHLYNLCRIKLLGLEKWEKESLEIRNKYYFGKLIPGAGPILEK